MSQVTLSTSASQNLASLKQLTGSMDDISYQLSTGKKVNSAVDDAITYFAAANDTQTSNDLSALKDSMSEGIQTIRAASNGISSIQDLISDAKSLAKSALSSDDTSEVNSYMDQFNALLDQIDQMAADSGYQGINLLGGSSESLVVTFDSSGDSSVTVTGIAADSAGLSLTEQATGAWSNATTGKTAINTVITALDTAKTTLRADAKTLSTQLSTIQTRQDYTDAMIKTLDDGAANLVNADTNTLSTELTTLQTQQELAIQALSITNNAQKAVLNLFQ